MRIKLALQLFDFDSSSKIDIFVLKKIVPVTMIDFVEVFFNYVHSRIH